jgi:FKBP-type peptidyl-prolyl cis-trans isomerase 2
MTVMKKMIRVGLNRMVALRYTMRNSSGEIIANTMHKEAIRFIYGSGEIVSGLEEALNGLRVGEHRSFKVSEDTAPGLNGTFQFDVIIDDITWADEPKSRAAANCGPDCLC